MEGSRPWWLEHFRITSSGVLHTFITPAFPHLLHAACTHAVMMSGTLCWTLLSLRSHWVFWDTHLSVSLMCLSVWLPTVCVCSSDTGFSSSSQQQKADCRWVDRGKISLPTERRLHSALHHLHRGVPPPATGTDNPRFPPPDWDFFVCLFVLRTSYTEGNHKLLLSRSLRYIRALTPQRCWLLHSDWPEGADEVPGTAVNFHRRGEKNTYSRF